MSYQAYPRPSYRQRANNRIIRPSADYIGVEQRSVPALDQR